MNLLNRISNHQTKSISFAALILSVFTFLSFVFGLLRDRLLTSGFGAGNELDVYYTAFRIPDFIAMVLITGAIGVAVIPIFARNLVLGREKAFSYLSNLLNIALVGLIAICFILFIFTPQLMSFLAPGFSPEKKELASLLTRIMLLSPILMGISNLISAVLRVFQKFLITALAPVFYNLGSIVGIVFFVPLFGISGLAWGIVLGAGLHLLIQLPALFKVGFRFSRLFSFKDKELLLTIKLALPRAVGLAASQINLIIITIIGSGLAAGSIGIFNLANDLSLPIIGLIAIPFSTAVFPSMSLDYSRGDKKELLRKFSSAFRQILFLIIPASAIAFLLRAQLVRIVFGAGRFNWSDTKLTAACFGLLMFGLFAGGLIYLLAKTFYSMHNTIIPALVSILSVASTVLFGYLFVWLFSFSNIVSNAVSLLLDVQGMHNLEVVGLAIALSLNSIIQLLLLIFFFRKDFPFKEIMHSFVRIIIASGAAVVFTYLVRQGLGGFTGTNRFWFLVLQAGTSGILGFCFYFLIAAAMKSPEASYIFKKVFHVRY